MLRAKGRPQKKRASAVAAATPMIESLYVVKYSAVAAKCEGGRHAS